VNKLSEKNMRPEPNSTVTEYRPDIDGLRAIAVLMVVLFHFELIPLARAGYLGVDVFFVISGYLITQILCRALDRGSFSLKKFYANRIRRLAPALVTTNFACVLIGWFVLLPREYDDLLMQTVAAQFYFSNIYFWKQINYFGLSADYVYLLHTWSLAVEEQFYILYPIAIAFVYRFFRRHLWRLLAIGFCLSLALCIALTPAKPEASFYLLPTRAWELLAGSLTYWVTLKFAANSSMLRTLGYCGASAIVVSVFAYRPEYMAPGWYALLPVLGASAIIYAGTRREGQLRFLRSRFLVYIGRISYPLYLVHWPINVFALTFLGDEYVWSIKAALAGLSFILASPMYHFIENPIRERRGGHSATTPLALYTVSVCLLSGLALSSVVSPGLPNRLPPTILRMAEFAEDRAGNESDCEFSSSKELNLRLCSLGDPREEASWLILGDSHAWAARSAFDVWLKERHERGHLIFRNSCVPVLGVDIFGDRGICRLYNDRMYELMKVEPTLRNVALVSSWRQVPEARLSSSSFEKLEKDEAVALFSESFDATLDFLMANQKSVYVWEPVPGATMPVPSSLARSELLGWGTELRRSSAVYYEDFAFLFSMLQRRGADISGRFAPADLLCGPSRCDVTINGVPAYYDNSHISQSLAGEWAKMMSRQVDSTD